MARKYEAIDLMALYAKGSANGWNEILTKCHEQQNINRLAKIRYQVQAGMDDLAKKNLNTDEINVWFCRLIKSLEKTAKAILRERHPMPGDNPLKAKEWGKDWLEAKRKRDQEFSRFMHDSRY